MLSQITSGTGSPQKLRIGKGGACAAFAYLSFKNQRSRPDTAFWFLFRLARSSNTQLLTQFPPKLPPS